MKHLIHILMLMLAIPAAAAHAQTGTGTTTTNIVGDLTVVNNRNLDFGKIALDAGSGGTATLNATTGALTTTGGLTAVGGTPATAEFIAYGPSSFLLTAVVPSTITLTRQGGTEQMDISTAIGAGDGWFNFFGALVRFVPASGLAPLHIGGTLTVPNDAEQGTYSANYDITINFF